MAQGKKYEFLIPKPYEYGYTPKKFQEGRAKAMLNQQPTDANQCAPNERELVPQHYRLAGGC